jgi:hypothetical protein
MRARSCAVGLVFAMACTTLPMCALFTRVAAQDQSPSDTTTAPAQSDDAGFETIPTTAAPDTNSGAEPSPWSLHSTLRVDATGRLTEPSPNRLGNLRQTFDAQLSRSFDASTVGVRLLASVRTEVDYAYLMNEAAYDRQTRQIYGAGVFARENFVALHVGGFELSLGRHIVNFGQAEMLSVLDVVNPRDLRTPLLIDPADMRMPVFATRLSWTLDALRFEAAIVHESYFGLLPPPLGEFSPLRKLLLSSPSLALALPGRVLSYEHTPGHSLSLYYAAQPHARITWTGGGFDLALHVSSVLDGLGVSGLPSPAEFALTEIKLPVFHPRYTMLGVSGSWTFATSCILRWEVAFDARRALTLRRVDTPLLDLGAERLHQLHGVLGFMYAPSITTSATLEVSKSYVFDNPARRADSRFEPLWPVEQPQFALRFNHQFLSERATLSLMGLWIGLQHPNAWVARGEIGYAIVENFQASIGAITYRPGASFGPFYGFENHDRVFAQIRWDYSL